MNDYVVEFVDDLDSQKAGMEKFHGRPDALRFAEDKASDGFTCSIFDETNNMSLVATVEPYAMDDNREHWKYRVNWLA